MVGRAKNREAERRVDNGNTTGLRKHRRAQKAGVARGLSNLSHKRHFLGNVFSSGGFHKPPALLSPLPRLFVLGMSDAD